MSLFLCFAFGGCFAGESWTDCLDIGGATVQCGERLQADLILCSYNI